MKKTRQLRSWTLGVLLASPVLATACGDEGKGSNGDMPGGDGGSAVDTGGTASAGKGSGAANSTGAGHQGGGAQGGTSGSSGGSGSGNVGNSGNVGGSAGSQNPPRTTINLTASGVPVEVLARSVIAPTADEYEGMGQHSGESVVLGLKIKLTGISLAEKPPGQPNARQLNVFDWSANPRELAIERGFAGSIADSVELDVPQGSYQVLQVSYLSQYDLKAYAYLDTDKNGEVDTTIFTTAHGVEQLDSVELPSALPDLDYLHYGFTYTHNADSPTASTTTSFDITLLPTPVVIGNPEPVGSGGSAGAGGTAGAGGSTLAGAPGLAGETSGPGAAGETGGPGGAGAEAGAAAGAPNGGAPHIQLAELGVAGANEGGVAGEMSGEGGAPVTSPQGNAIDLTLFIDSFRVVKAWDGVPPSSPSDHVDVLFPQGDAEARTNQFGVDLVDLYPIGVPTFGLQYLPTFAFANVEGYTSQTYLIAPSEPYLVANTQTLSVIFDADGRPIIGRTGGNVDAVSLQLGQAARMFETIGEDEGAPLYRYYVEYGIKDANNVDDGGMYYHNDKTMAGHTVEGFRELGAVGESAALHIEDGPRCNAEYNRCYGPRAAVMRRVR